MEELFESMNAVANYHTELIRLMNAFTNDLSMLLMEVPCDETPGTNS